MAQRRIQEGLPLELQACGQGALWEGLEKGWGRGEGVKVHGVGSAPASRGNTHQAHHPQLCKGGRGRLASDQSLYVPHDSDSWRTQPSAVGRGWGGYHGEGEGYSQHFLSHSSWAPPRGTSGHPSPPTETGVCWE